MEEKEYDNICPIPTNYTDSGKILGGMISPRNAVETIVLVAIIGFLEFTLIPMSGTVRIVLFAMTLIPLAIVSLMGIDGNSLIQYLGHVIRFVKNKRKLHYKAGYRYEL